MKISPVIALRKAVVAQLSTNAQIAAALSGPKIYDEAPRSVGPPYVLLGDAQMRDWSASGSSGAEQFLTLGVVSNSHGARQALEIAQMIVEALDEAQLALEGHALVDLRFVSTETRRSQDGRHLRANLRFRAMTESLPGV